MLLATLNFIHLNSDISLGMEYMPAYLGWVDIKYVLNNKGDMMRPRTVAHTKCALFLNNNV